MGPNMLTSCPNDCVWVKTSASGSSRPEKAHSDAATPLRIGVDSPVPVISPAIAGPAPKAATVAAQAALANSFRIAYLLIDAAEAQSYSGGRTRSIVGLARQRGFSPRDHRQSLLADKD
jgi:hypothetical protein